MTNRSELPLTLEFLYGFVRRKIRVDLCGGEIVVAQEPLEGWKADAFLKRGDRECVTEDDSRHRVPNLRAACHGIDDAVYVALAIIKRIVQAEVGLEQRNDAVTHRHNAALTVLTGNRETVRLPINVIFG